MRIFRSKRLAGSIGLAMVTPIALASIAYAAVTFGPSRPTFTWAHPANYITFNSITNNPDSSIGDERYFVSARDNAASDKLTYLKTLNVSDNEEVLVRVYFHNDAASNLNLVATNTKARVTLPAGENTTQSAVATIMADNSNPTSVWSEMDFKATQPFTLTYEPGTARLWTQTVVGTSVSDNIVTSGGALIGSDAANGRVPGCSEFSGYVTIKVRVHMQTPPVTPPVTPPQVLTTKTLPNTGPGSIVALFVGVSAAGAAGHYLVTRRRQTS